MGTVLKIAEFTFLVLLLCHLASCSVPDTLTFCQGFVTGQQQWNRSTPNLQTNLLNWKSGNCLVDLTACPCYNPTGNWGGVTCLRYDSPELNCTIIWTVSLELSDASIVGTLPPAAILNLARLLVTLSLTGNPKLTGTLDALNNITGPLNILDLHDNGFYGPIPTQLSFVESLVQLDLSGNQLTGGFPNELMNLTSLEQISIARNKLNGNISYDVFHDLIQLITVDLSGNNFTGPPPNFANLNKLYYLNISYTSFTDLPTLPEVFESWLPKGINQSMCLRVLDLSGLNIGGRLPDWNSSPDLLSLEQLFLNENNFIGELNVTSIKSGLARTASTSNYTLQVLSLMNNNITDVIFDKTKLTDGLIEIYLLGNPYCNDTSKDPDGRRCFCEQFCAISSDSSTKNYVAVISITTAICGVVLGSVILILVCILKRKTKDIYALLKRKIVPEYFLAILNPRAGFEECEVTAKRFDYSVLRTATKHFAQERKLGQGASGAVYKGILPNETEIAVKQLFMKTQEASEDFLNEIRLITNLQHRNLVGLKGYSLHGREMLLVYDYVDYCDLEKLLFRGSNKCEMVTWPARMNICLGIAQGLYYLHASSQTRIIHRDIKASNILLDRNLNPKIADFGLARPMQDEKTETLTGPVGTRGYLAPEYVLYGQLSEKADVYSFGVLLLEIVSRKRNRDPTRPDDDIYLPMLASKLHQEKRLMELKDPKLQLKSDCEALEVQRVLETALMCVQTSPERRPSMFRVVAMLAGDSDPLDGPINFQPEFEICPGYSDQDLESLLISKGSEHFSNRKWVSLELSCCSTSVR